MINISGNIGGVYVGSTEISEAYIGNQLVYRSAPIVLPYDAQVEYLQSSGTQYIDTGIIPNDNTGLHIRVSSSNTSDTYVVGLRNSSGNTRWCIGHASSGYYYAVNSVSQRRYKLDPAEIYFNYLNDKKFHVVDSTTGDGSIGSLAFTPSYNIRLFGSAGMVASYSKWSGKIYYVKITQGDALVMDLIPVRVGTVGYMYDKISKQLFGNDGTDSFTLGSDVTT